MFTGTGTALITPFTEEGLIDWDALAILVEEQGGVDFIVPCGTTGESATLSHDEHREVISFAVKQVAGRCRVIAGTGSNNTREALALTRHAAEVGADAALLITPYYNRPTQEGLFRHFAALAESCGIDLVLYNVPSRTGVDLAAETVARLAELPRVVAIKEASGDVTRVSRIRELLSPGASIEVLSGDDALAVAAMALGAVGVVSVTANLVPELVQRMVGAMLAGDGGTARELHERIFPLSRVLFCSTNPIPVKAAMAERGWAKDVLRLPLVPLEPAARAALRGVLERMS